MSKRKPWINWTLFLLTALVVFLVAILGSLIIERKTQAQFAYKPSVIIDEFEPRNDVWGENYPRQYQSYIQTADTTFRSKYHGNAVIDMLSEYPRLVVLWAGYGFSKDYNQGRGHYYAIDDVYNTLRTGAPFDPTDGPMPATCWTCKSPDVPRLMNEIGVKEFYSGKWASKGEEIHNAIGCADCHNPETMSLQISRPALIEAFERQGKNIEEVSHQEMRSLVCAQCHVEYYFDKDRYEGVAYLTLPWDNGLTVEGMEEYYDNIEFSDWIHPLSRAPMLKAQHPGYEVYLTGVHADRQVACADCHMPYRSEGGQKFTDHKIQSPLNNVHNSCQICHREEYSTLLKDVFDRQDKILHNRNKLEELLVRAHVEAKLAWDLGATNEQMKDILQDIRHGQWRWDYAAASHGGSFHSPIETSRIIGTGITIIQEGRIKLTRVLSELGHNDQVPYPDISTKEKAQKFIGLDVDKLNQDKKEFLKTIVPQWKQKAEEREASWETLSYQ